MEKRKKSQNITVAIRVKPLLSNAFKSPPTVEITQSKIIRFDCGDTNRPLGSIGIRRRKNKTFMFDRAFNGETETKEVYEEVAKPAVMDSLKGYDATIFAYGATGSGKTHTMIGNRKGGPGVIVLAMSDVFETIKNERKNSSFAVEVSYFEIYNERIYDLVSNTTKKALPIRFSKVEGAAVVGLSKHNPTNIEQVTELLAKGNLLRSQSPTDKNAESSRSHAIFQVRLDRKSFNDPSINTTAKLSLIDLAGSERASCSRNTGALLREGANINRSLLALGNCINALSQQQKTHIPFRDSNLTRLLSRSLRGCCRTVMLATVCPSHISLEDTANTLKYASNAKLIELGSKKNKLKRHLSFIEYEELVKKLKNEILELKQKIPSSQGEIKEELIEDVKKIEKSQENVWRLKKKKLLCDAEGRAVKTQLEYWTRRKEKLNLVETPQKLRKLRQNLNIRLKHNQKLANTVATEQSRLLTLRRRLLNQTRSSLAALSDNPSRLALAKSLRHQIDQLEWREKEFARLLAEQQTELLKMKNKEDLSRVHVVALLETIAFFKEVMKHNETRTDETSFKISAKEMSEMEVAFSNARDVAEFYGLEEIEEMRGTNETEFFTPKKFKKNEIHGLNEEDEMVDENFNSENVEFYKLFDSALRIDLNSIPKKSQKIKFVPKIVKKRSKKVKISLNEEMGKSSENPNFQIKNLKSALKNVERTFKFKNYMKPLRNSNLLSRTNNPLRKR